MAEITHFGLIVLIVAAIVALAVFSNKLSERFPIPAPAIFLLAAAAAAAIWPRLGHQLSIKDVERVAVVALVLILFDGGMRVGWKRFRAAAAPICVLGVVGTFATAGLIALAGRYLFDFSWTGAGMLGAALAPTDPAVMFSVLGVLLVLYGIFGPKEIYAKSLGINVNLWWGAVMLVFGAAMWIMAKRANAE